ncbi:hypothetical protein IV487_05490 [Enterococcus saccharolyticus]|uniref:Uncharacterized protein n=1 Tax=Candidatus Enterococcus willemsii TaxID=1857215 RepID=A0ABQ6YXN6_9ENTE|nr:MULTISPECIES: hypothetical protein [Enterococcus]KAF1302095.1 hypothetical protein BAU17_01610 [Enterococcus sp. CU12B]MCD5001927.1 hypothetical protein [Enterococcus saccharolyticus]
METRKYLGLAADKQSYINENEEAQFRVYSLDYGWKILIPSFLEDENIKFLQRKEFDEHTQEVGIYLLTLQTLRTKHTKFKLSYDNQEIDLGPFPLTFLAVQTNTKKKEVIIWLKEKYWLPTEPVENLDTDDENEEEDDRHADFFDESIF